jgi:hypothetical protein
MKRAFYIVLLLIFSFSFSSTAYAEGDFFASPIFDSSQKDLSKGYFIVNGKPGEKVQFSLKVENNNKEQSSFIVKPTDAFSNPFSIMEYTNEKETEYSSFLDNNYRFTKLFPEIVEFKLNPGDSKNVLFEAVIPLSLDSGHILGAFQVEETNLSLQNVKTSEEASKKSSNVELTIKKRFTLGALIHLTESGDVDLNFVSLSSYVEGILPVISLELENAEPYIADNLSIDYQVYKKSSKRMLFENSQDIFSLAPSTSIKLPLKWLYKDYEADSYTMNFRIYNKKTNETLLESSENFVIESKDVKNYVDKNEQEGFFFPNAINDNLLLYLNLIALGTIGLFIYKRRNKKTTIIEENIETENELEIDTAQEEDQNSDSDKPKV